ncbi:hypothetical protein BB561_005716 [Smittium simulii]|uniref:Transcriptional repressor Tup1 N-terminal domain-containing protein n=1 Tax=Smittium simulii TaxID=133385 RepID=A0A2T9Y8W0_9FUNG|nr:hypothetical protein BB561_005716 [Smittium simulii]
MNEKTLSPSLPIPSLQKNADIPYKQLNLQDSLLAGLRALKAVQFFTNFFSNSSFQDPSLKPYTLHKHTPSSSNPKPRSKKESRHSVSRPLNPSKTLNQLIHYQGDSRSDFVLQHLQPPSIQPLAPSVTPSILSTSGSLFNGFIQRSSLNSSQNLLNNPQPPFTKPAIRSLHPQTTLKSNDAFVNECEIELSEIHSNIKKFTQARILSKNSANINNSSIEYKNVPQQDKLNQEEEEYLIEMRSFLITQANELDKIKLLYHQKLVQIEKSLEDIELFQNSIEKELALLWQNPQPSNNNQPHFNSSTKITTVLPQNTTNLDTPLINLEPLGSVLDSSNSLQFSTIDNSIVPFNKIGFANVDQFENTILDPFKAGHYGGITALDYSKTFGMVALGSLDTRVTLWDIESGHKLYTIDGHTDIIRGVQFYEKYLLTGGNDGRVRMWDLALVESISPKNSFSLDEFESNETQRSGKKYYNKYNNEEYSDDSDDAENYYGNKRNEATRNRFGSSSDYSTTPIMSPSLCNFVSPIELCCEANFVGHKGPVTCFEASGDTLLSASIDGIIREFDLKTGLLRQKIDLEWLSSNKSTAASNVTEYGARESDGVENVRGDRYGNGGRIGALRFRGPALVTGNSDGIVQLWDRRNNLQIRAFKGHRGPITSLVLNDNYIATGGADCNARLWDLRMSCRNIETFEIQSSTGVTGVSFNESSNGHNSARNSGSFVAAGNNEMIYNYNQAARQTSVYKMRQTPTRSKVLEFSYRVQSLGELGIREYTGQHTKVAVSSNSKQINTINEQLEEHKLSKPHQTNISSTTDVTIKVSKVLWVNDRILTGFLDGSAAIW